MEEQRMTRYRKKRLRKGRIFFLLLFLLISIIGSYSFIQFRAGAKLAGDSKLPEEAFTPDKPSDDMENYLILGVDSRGEEKSRTDTMMLLSWQKKTNDMKLVSFMRDIYAEIPGYQSYKLNTAYYLGGVQLTKDTISQMFHVPIHHYAIIDFKQFESLVDILVPNGVEMDVEKDMSENIDVSIKKGKQKLNGQELLGYARFRMDKEGDFGRVNRQQKVIEALKDEVLSLENVKNLPKAIGAAQGYVSTDVGSMDQLKTVLSIAVGGGVNIDKMTIPLEGTYQFQSYSHAGSVLEIDIEKNQQAIHDFLQMK
ncbi:LCP family protein [Lysinibacillus sp. 54212]|uniref:LCP family protein n=1 Tax=Lysinibacillus sp. 54212 TaxID=3119829 RepID=UPI002FCBABFF